MKKTAITLLLTIMLLCVPVPVLANSFGISPSSAELEVPKDGSAVQDFTVFGFDGMVTIGLEGIPLTITPTSIDVTDGETITVTFYGDGTNNTYEGKITFLASMGEQISAGIKVRLTVHINCSTEIILPLVTGEVVTTVPAGQTDIVIDATDIADTTITVDTIGEVTITVKKYAGNPHPGVALPATMIPRYIDIEVDNPDNIVWPMYVEQAYTDAEVAGLTESSLAMYYFKAAAWHRCSNTGVNTGPNTIWANMIKDELSGSPVAIGGAVIPAPALGGGGGGGGSAPPDTTPPTMSNISASNIGRTGADISWITDEPSTSQVEYWTSPGKFSPFSGAHVTEHHIELANLAPDTTYYYKTMSRDAAGNLAVSDECTFTTLVELVLMPPIPAIFVSSSLGIVPTEVDIGEVVTISVLVTNTGGQAGSYTIALNVEGVVEATWEVTLDAGVSETVIFTTTVDVAGIYSIDVDGLTGSFTVKEELVPLIPFNWPLFGGIVGGIVAGLLVITGVLALIANRRRHQRNA